MRRSEWFGSGRSHAPGQKLPPVLPLCWQRSGIEAVLPLPSSRQLTLSITLPRVPVRPRRRSRTEPRRGAEALARARQHFCARFRAVAVGQGDCGHRLVEVFGLDAVGVEGGVHGDPIVGVRSLL